MNEEILALFKEFQNRLMAEGYDFLVVTGRPRSDGKGYEGVTGISYNHTPAVLPSMLLGGCTQDEKHRHFVQDLVSTVIRLGRESGVIRPADDESEKVYPN